MGTSVDAFVGRFVGAFEGVLEGLKTGKSTLVGPVVGALVGDLVGALVGPLVGPLVVPLVDPLVGRGSLSAVSVRRPVSSLAKLRPWSELTAKMVMGVVPGLVNSKRPRNFAAGKTPRKQKHQGKEGQGRDH